MKFKNPVSQDTIIFYIGALLNYHPYSITLGNILFFGNHNNGEDC